MKTAKDRWTPEETSVLREHYFDVPTATEFRRSFLPERSDYSIRHKAKRLNILRASAWERVVLFEHLSSETLAYFAGILDGEGYIRTDPKHICIQIVNTDKNLIDWLHNVFGGTVSFRNMKDKPNCKDQWKWHLTRKDRVLNLLYHIYPLLIVKREKALYLLNKYGVFVKEEINNG